MISFKLDCRTIHSVMPFSLPEAIPAFIPIASPVVEERNVRKIDPSALFEDWTSDQVFDPTNSDTLSTFASGLTAEATTSELASSETTSTEIVSESTSTPTTNTKSRVKLVTKNNDAYWSESDRLTRFGRRRTSASCSSTRLRALTQIA